MLCPKGRHLKNLFLYHKSNQILRYQFNITLVTTIFGFHEHLTCFIIISYSLCKILNIVLLMYDDSLKETVIANPSEQRMHFVLLKVAFIF